MTWGKGSFLLLNVKWNTLSLTGKRIVCCFFTMHPSNRDHKDMQKRGVQTFQARVGSGVVVVVVVVLVRGRGRKIKRWEWQDMPGCMLIKWEGGQSEGSITFKVEELLFLTFDSEVRNSMKYLQVRCDQRPFSVIPPCIYHTADTIAEQSFFFKVLHQ